MSWDIDILMKLEKAKAVVKPREEKRTIFEAFVFRICANWQILVEELFINCLGKDTSMYKKYTGFDVPKHIPRDTCKAILLGTGYWDFKSVSDIKRQAKRILLPGCNPFKEIENIQEKKIDEFHAIRNYLAHYSDASWRALKKIYQNEYGFNKFIEPGRFLLANEKKANIPRMGVYINNFTDTADTMAKFLGIEVEERK